MNGFSKWWGGLSPENQFRFAVLMIVVIILILIALRGSIKGLANGLGSAGELGGLALAGIKPSFTDASYIKAADQLYAAVKGAGTDEPKVFQIFGQMKNNADIIKLDLAFGVRSGMNMKEWIHDDLNASEIAQLNSILLNKGITKTF